MGKTSNELYIIGQVYDVMYDVNVKEKKVQKVHNTYRIPLNNNLKKSLF